MKVVVAFLFVVGGAQALQLCIHDSHDYIMFHQPATEEHLDMLDFLSDRLVAGNWLNRRQADRCVQLSIGYSLGFHNPGNGGQCPDNCLADDDPFVLRHGCENKVTLEMSDTYARAVALGLCARYIRMEQRMYGISVMSHGGEYLWGNIARAIPGLDGLHAYSRRKSCDSAKRLEETLVYVTGRIGQARPQFVCWDFVKAFVSAQCAFQAMSDKAAAERQGKRYSNTHLIGGGDTYAFNLVTWINEAIQFTDGVNRAVFPPEAWSYGPADLVPYQAVTFVDPVDECRARMGDETGAFSLEYKKSIMLVKIETADNLQRTSGPQRTTTIYPIDCANAMRMVARACQAGVPTARCCGSINQYRHMSVGTTGATVPCSMNAFQNPLRTSLLQIEAACPTGVGACATSARGWEHLESSVQNVGKCSQPVFDINLSVDPVLDPRSGGTSVFGVTVPGSGGGAVMTDANEDASQSSSKLTASSLALYKTSAAAMSVSSVGMLAALEKSARFSREQVIKGADWADRNMPTFIAAALQGTVQWLSATVEGLNYLLERSVLQLARISNMCPGYMSDEHCVCAVIKPLMEKVNEIQDNKAALLADMKANDDCDETVCAVVLSVGVGVDGRISVGVSSAHVGIYVEIQFSNGREAMLGFEVGVYGGVSETLSIGTSALDIAGSAEFHVGLFFGKNSQKAHHSKSVSFGAEMVISGLVSVSLLFREEYHDKLGDLQCAPYYVLEDASPASVARAFYGVFGLPASATCIRGFQLSFELGAGTTPHVSFNIGTAYGVGKSFALFGYRDGMASGVLGDAVSKTATVVNQVMPEFEEHSRLRSDLRALESHLGLNSTQPHHRHSSSAASHVTRNNKVHSHRRH